MSAAPDYVLFCAAKTNLFQSPPFERPGGDEVLILRQPASDEGQQDTWRFPIVGEFDHPAELVPWTDGTVFARVDEKFTPPDLPGCDFEWMLREFAITCNGSIFHPSILPALRRFDGPLLDQIMAWIEARADSNSQGDFSMGTSTAELQRQLDALKRQIGPPAGDPQEFRQAQAKADSVFRAIGDSAGAPPFMSGERLLDYRCRLLAPLQKFSAQFKSSNLYRVGDPTALSAIEDSIYNDAMTALRDPRNYGPGELRAIKRQDATGRELTSYVGHEGSCWDQFNQQPRYVTKFNTSVGRA
jgi:hypothetical protein